MTVLFVATRSPWPSVDGGRVLMAQTIEGLRARGHRVIVVAPTLAGAAPPAAGSDAGAPAPDRDLRLVPVTGRGWLSSLCAAPRAGRPAAIERHHHPAVTRELLACLAGGGIDVIHAQQLQALVHVPAARGGPPVVLRAENVEAELWRQSGAAAWWGPMARLAGRGLARWETAALGQVAATAAVSEPDAAALRRLAPAAAVHVVRIPMPARLPAGRPIAGAPAIVLMAGTWWPNRHGASWFLRRVWPRVAARLPAARLHVFGLPGGMPGTAGVIGHARPASSIDAFPEGAIAVVPLRIASGANVRILEAWARGVPVVATPMAAAGVDPGDGAAIATASTPAAFVDAFARLSRPEARRRAVEAGRAALDARHDPAAMAARLEDVYSSAIVAGGTP